MDIINFDQLRKEKMEKENPKYILYIENREKPLGFEVFRASNNIDELVKGLVGDRRKFVIDFYSPEPSKFVLTEFQQHFTERKEIAEDLIEDLKQLEPIFRDFDFGALLDRFRRIIDNIEKELRKLDDRQ